MTEPVLPSVAPVSPAADPGAAGLAEREVSPPVHLISRHAVAWSDAVARLLGTSHLAQPNDLAGVVNEALRPMGVACTIYLADLEQECMWALPEAGHAPAEEQSIDTTLAGRAFRTMAPATNPSDPTQVWTPVIDGTERLGVALIRLPKDMPADNPDVVHGIARLAVLVGHLIVTKMPYGDTLRRARHSRPTTIAGELLWRLLPPLTFATHDLVLSTTIEPCYAVGGDAFDYAVDDDVASIAIFDALGHDLNATLTATLALAATRTARTEGADLVGIAAAADQALTSHFADLRYVTGILGQLDLRTGRLRLVNAGHPPPVLLRAGRSVATLDGGRRLPLGLADAEPEPVEVSLEPGDLLLLYTDGITEARGDDDELFGVARLIHFAERQAASGYPAPEVVRRLSHAVLHHHQGELQDDATLMVVQWGPGVGDRLGRRGTVIHDD